MLEEILKIEKKNIDKEEINTINARNLYRGLEIKRQFSDWIKDQLELFVEGVDYIKISISQKSEAGINKKRMPIDNLLAGQNKIDYFLTIDTAKHIALMSRTQKGKKIRQYFIEIEKKYIKNLIAAPQPQPTPTYTPKELVEIFLELCPFFKNRKIYKLKHFYKKYCDWLDYNKVDRKFFGDRTFKTALFRNGFHFIELEKDVGCFYTDIADYNYINSEYDIALYYKHHIKTQEYRENAGLIINDSLSLITSRETINEVIDTMVEEKTIALINEYKTPAKIKNDINYNKEDKSYYIEYNYNNVPYYYNIVNQFVTEMLIYDVSSAITCFDVYNVFRKWCIDKSINPITHNKFGRGLYSFGINKTYVNGDLKGYGGIKFNDRVEV